MPVDLHLGPHMGDTAGLVDQEGGPRYPHELLPVHGFLAPHSVGLEHLVGLVGGERDGEVVLRLEGVLRRDGIGGHAEHSDCTLLTGR